MKEMTAKQLRNEIVNKLWAFNNVPKNIQTLIDDNEVVFMMEIIKTYSKEQLSLFGVVRQSEQLKDSTKPSFEEWLEMNNYEPYKNAEYKDENDCSWFSNELLKMYNDEHNL